MISFKGFKGSKSLVDSVNEQAHSILSILVHYQCEILIEYLETGTLNNDAIKSQDLMPEFKAKGNLEKDFPVIYLVCEAQKHGHSKVFAWGLAAIFISEWDQHFDGLIRKVCRYFRQIERNKNDKYQSLKMIFNKAKSLTELHFGIHDYSQALSGDPGRQKEYNLARAIYSLTEHVVTGGKKINLSTRDRGRKREVVIPHGMMQHFELNELVGVNHYYKSDELAIDKTKVKTSYYCSPKNRKENRTLHQKALAIKSTKSIAYFSPVSDTNQISLEEAREVVSRCRKINKAEATATILLLLLGINVAQLYSLKLNKLQLSSNFEVPKHKGIKYNGVSLLYSVNSKFNLWFPKQIAQRFKELQDSPVTEDCIRQFLKSEFHSSIRPICISNFLWNWCQRNRVDIAIKELISSDKAVVPQSFYTTISVDKLNEVWMHYLSELGIEAHCANTKELIGSKLSISTSYLKAFYSHLKQVIECSLKRKDAVDFLNAYSIYLYHIIILATGRRPQEKHSIKVSDISFVISLIRIEDKSSKGVSSPRLVYLPKWVTEQIRDYLKILQECTKRFLFDKPILATRIRERLEGRAELIEFIDTDHRPNRLTSRLISTLLQDVWPLPLNWQRHFLRSYFIKQEIPQCYVDCFMGHQNQPSNHFGRLGGMSLSDIKYISISIERLFIELSVSFVPLYRRFKYEV